MFANIKTPTPVVAQIGNLQAVAQFLCNASKSVSGTFNLSCKCRQLLDSMFTPRVIEYTCDG